MAEGRGDGGGTPTARRIVLGSQLRKLRERLEITRAAAGFEIRGSESKISRMELGRVSFKERDVADLLTMYGVDDAQEREQFLAMVKEANEPGWWHRYSDLMPNWFHDYVGLEESASRIQTCELQFVPGLMQTEDYSRALATHGRPDLSTPETERRVTLRQSRQKVLHRTDAPKLWAVIDESVLHRPIGGARVLREQIDHLLELTRLPNISLQIVPYSLSGYAAEGAFTMLRFNEMELPNLLYIEHLGGALYLDRPEEIERYSRVIDRLTVDADTPVKSRQTLLKRRAEL
ncbi:MAG: helix-turn-helix domain-containing protein [Actinomycetota bacterium]|nr:helix-turn-helix domain-containing protein [Actinomycetota bacterium]